MRRKAQPLFLTPIAAPGIYALFCQIRAGLKGLRYRFFTLTAGLKGLRYRFLRVDGQA
jgi:hypothetical protein